jgi:L-asparagine oxygenase
MVSIIELYEEEINILLNLTEHITENPSENPEEFCNQIKEYSENVPRRIKNILREFAKNGSETGFLLIRRLPIGLLPDTPPGNSYKIGEKTQLAKVQAILISVMSEIVAYEAESYGRLFQDVVPIQSMANVQTSLGSNAILECHTEQAFSYLRPDILSLACLRGDPNAFTYILPVKYILENLSLEERNLLRQRLWNTGVDLSFKLNNHEFIHGDIRGPMAIIQGSEEDPYLVFDQDLMTGICPKSHEILGKIVELYEKHRIEHNLTPGEIIFVDNNRAVHGRSPFFPKFNGKDRFLIRCFATYDYEKCKYATDKRKILAIHS